jgi:hypothetical protein
MILYSVIPSEIVFGNFDEAFREYREMDYLGQKVLVSALSNNSFEIVRVLSTSPKVFLNPKLQPGQLIEQGHKS